MKGILVLNAGSSSLRFAVFGLLSAAEEPQRMLHGQISDIGGNSAFKASLSPPLSAKPTRIKEKAANIDNHRAAIDFALSWITQRAEGITLIAAGHRVVHGGKARKAPARVTPGLLDELEALCKLAPHHQPHNLAAIHALAAAQPSLPQVACFDTAFHASQDATARRLPLPRSLREQGLQRYGFHGLSYEYISTAVPEYNRGQIPEKLIVTHLGNGASLCAIENGRSIATSMGFSTLDGLLMGSRCGTLDPGVLLHLMHEQKMDEAALSDLLYNQSGLLGVSGISADMQVLLSSEERGAKEAIELFCYTLQRAIGSMAAALGGVDAIVFTGGIGENAEEIRSRVCTRLAWLGLSFDEKANRAGEQNLSTEGSAVQVWVIPTNEELVIARHTMRLI